MGTPGTLETLGGSGLETFLRGVLVLFVLSLGAERIAAIFKRRDWQPLRPRFEVSQRRKKSGNIQVDLRTGQAYVEGQPAAPVVMGDNAVDRLTRAANAENTLFIGLLVALLTGANAFQGTCGWPDLAQLHFSFVAQVLLTGSASAVGSSFWYELLNALIEARRARSAGSVPEDFSPLLPGRPVTPLPYAADPFATPLEALRAAALLRLPELRALPGVKAVRLVDAPRRWPSHPCLEFVMEARAGRAPPSLRGVRPRRGPGALHPGAGMIGDWSATRLGGFARNQPLAGGFTPVASLEARAWNRSQSASGLLVHPRLVVTVAHAVLFHAGARLFAAAQVKVELGNVRAWADAVVIPSRFLQNAGFLGSVDLAVLRMPWAVSGPLQPPIVAEAPREGGAVLWGWSLARPRTRSSHPVEVSVTPEGTLRYPSADLPAFSGGPLLRGTGPQQSEEVIGLHRAYHSDTQQGEAVVFSSDDVIGAMRALGFSV